MKNLKKFFASMLVTATVVPLCFFAKADTFEATGRLRTSISDSVMTSRAVIVGGRTPKSISDVCNLRIRFLEGILREVAVSSSDPASLVSNYAGACSLPRENLEISLLLRSGTKANLIKNVQTVIRIYKMIRPKTVKNSDAASERTHSRAKKHYEGTRPGRKGQYPKGAR